jgi:hypothetical protein
LQGGEGAVAESNQVLEGDGRASGHGANDGLRDEKETTTRMEFFAPFWGDP